MQRFLLRAKLQGIRVTATRLEYDGSITLDDRLMEAAGLAPYELVHVLNLNSGARFETYVITGARGRGAVELNGPAARLGEVGDPVIVLAYGLFPDGAAAAPRNVRCLPGNRLPAGRGGDRAGRRRRR